MSAVKPATEPHRLVRDATVVRADRRIRPWQLYACSCGHVLPGASRRQVKPHHLAHRKRRIASAG